MYQYLGYKNDVYLLKMKGKKNSKDNILALFFGCTRVCRWILFWCWPKTVRHEYKSQRKSASKLRTIYLFIAEKTREMELERVQIQTAHTYTHGFERIANKITWRFSNVFPISLSLCAVVLIFSKYTLT